MSRVDSKPANAATPARQDMTKNAVAWTLDDAKEPKFEIDFQNADLPDPKLRRFHEIWLSKCEPGRLPGRADFDPVDLPPDLLPWIAIIDVVGTRFRIRIMGTGIVGALNLEPTGLHLDDLPNSEGFVSRARWVVEKAKPFFVANLPVPWDKERYSRYAVLCTPLATNGVDVDKLIYVISFDNRTNGDGTT